MSGMEKQPHSILVMQPWLNYRGAETQSIQLCEDFNNEGIYSRILCLYVTDAIKNQVDPALLILPPTFIQNLLQVPLWFYLLGLWVLSYHSIKIGNRFSVY